MRIGMKMKEYHKTMINQTSFIRNRRKKSAKTVQFSDDFIATFTQIIFQDT
jgi:hypothetical protein